MKIISRSDCQLIVDVEHAGRTERLRYFIITGGTPALSFENHHFTEQFDQFRIPNYTDNNYRQHKPTIDTIGGEPALIAYLEKWLPKYDLRKARFEGLPVRKLKSKRLRDPGNACYFHAVWQCYNNVGVPTVTVESKYYAGQPGQLLERLDPYWRELTELFDKIKRSRNAWVLWEDLTEEEYQQVVSLLSRHATPNVLSV